jgi:hypothetical protein
LSVPIMGMDEIIIKIEKNKKIKKIKKSKVSKKN